MTPRLGRRTGPATVARTLAQAKVNLFLRVLAREASGYHQLETLFCRLDLGDDVVVRTNVRGRSLDCSGDVIPPTGLGPVEWNLAWRAATAYAEVTGWPNDFAVEIEKRIPVGGGLGGGSSNAGAVLRCLNTLAPSPLSDRDLLAIATPLGADVPFLTSESSLALAWGRGERMLSIDSLAPRAVTLICFSFGVSTRDAYAWLDESRDTDAPVPNVIEQSALSSWGAIARIAHNDFSDVVVPKVDAISAAVSSLESAAPSCGEHTIVLLAGSGATVFMVADATDSSASNRLTMSGVQHRTVHTRTSARVVDVQVSD
jgi:4-diphosphocytidyl-2-C-methyl-D-erythritol kinase